MALGDMNFIFLCWKYFSLVRFAHLWEILSALENKIRIPMWPCNILYIQNGEYEYEFENDLDKRKIAGQFFSKFYLDMFCRHL